MQYPKILVQIFKWPFRLFRALYLTTILGILVAISLLIHEHFTSKEKYYADGACQTVADELGDFARRINGPVDCLNTSASLNDIQVGETRYLIMLVASDPLLGRSDTGHAWTLWAAVTQEGEDNFAFRECEAIGFSPGTLNWSTNLTKYYSDYLVPHIPAAFAPAISRFVANLNMTLISSGEGMANLCANDKLQRGNISSVFGSAFPQLPDVLTVLVVDELQFVKSKKVGQDYRNGTYRILINDCTTFIQEVAQAVNLYVPVRMLRPYPGGYLRLISEWNRAKGSSWLTGNSSAEA